MFKNFFKGFFNSLGRVFAYILMAGMSILGIVFFLNKNNKYSDKKKKLKLYVKNPQSKNDKEKGEQLEKDIDSLLSD